MSTPPPQSGKTLCDFCGIPAKPHGLQKVTHQTRKMEEEIRWFDNYLFGTHKPENEAFKEESPLAELLQKEKPQTANGLYGVMQNGVLIPETVSIRDDSTAIGQFEVTNAQYAEFDQEHSYPEVRANYPVTGIKAQQYIRWLNKQTGEAYRLPNSNEANNLSEQAQKVASSENTLNYWTGYDITLDDVPRIPNKAEAAVSLHAQGGRLLQKR